MKEISKAELKSVLLDKLALYHSLQRNRYFLPKLSSRICTVEYMLRVRSGTIWVPKFEQVRLAPCPLPPTKKEFVEEIFRHLESSGADIELGFSAVEWEKVDIEWA